MGSPFSDLCHSTAMGALARVAGAASADPAPCLAQTAIALIGFFGAARVHPQRRSTSSIRTRSSIVVEESLVLSSGANAGILVPGSNYCARLLTLTGITTTTDTCPW